MAISYTNIFYENVLSGVEKLLRTEFDFPVSTLDHHSGSESLLLIPEDDAFISHDAGSQTRSYSINIQYQTRMAAMPWEFITKRSERIKRLIFNNAHYVDTTYKWHDGFIESVSYETDEDDDNVRRANISFNCTVRDVL
jgi:hypothetical protein